LKNYIFLLISFLITQNTQHILWLLFIPEHSSGIITGTVPVNHNVFRGRNEAVFDAAVTTDGVLICSGIEKAYV
jgi:hypothetical protein